jgi:indolepyruvate ferredoxin oxidoreductase beta subunit
MNKNFNIIISGVGGHGIITLIKIIDEAAFIDGYDVKSSELHGLAQRGGSVLAHIKFGKKIYSPLVSDGSADLVIATELMEGLRTLKFLNSKTQFLVNKNLLPFIGGLSEEKIMQQLPKKNIQIVEASKICIEKFGKEAVSTIYLLGLVIRNNLIPLKQESVLKAIEKIVPDKYLDLNIKAFNSHD